MKKLALYVSLALAGLFMGSCSSDYTDWASPQSHSQESSVTIPGFTATAVGAQNLDTNAETVPVFTLSSAVLPEGYELSNARIELTPTGVDNATTTTLSTTVDGQAKVADLQELIKSIYGLRPVNRTFNAHVYVNAVKNGEAALIDAGTIQVQAAPKAPVIDTKYYLTGGINGWNNSDTSIPVVNSGADPYADPVFTVILTADQVGNGTEFKLTPQSGLGGDWSQCVTASTTDPATKLSDKNAGGNLKITPIDGAMIYRVTFNLLDQTWGYVGLSFNDYLYLAGNCNGWQQIDYLYGPAFDGKYTGFMYLDQGGFKFCTQANWDGTNYGTGMSTDPGAGNIVMSEAPGYYKVDVDLSALTYKLTPITTIGVIGSATAGGWNDDQNMTYNQTDRCWEIKGIVLTDGVIKFRANDAWTINWGGSFSALTQGGADIAVTAGTYNIKLYAWCDGKAKAEVTAAAGAKAHK